MERCPKIVVVEDDDQLCKFMKRIFEHLLIDCSVKRSCEEAKKYCVANRVEFLLVDLNVEHFHDGLQLLEQMAEIHPEITRILYTGEDPDDQIQHAIDSGVGHHFIRKPLHVKDLVEAINVRRQA